MNYQPADHRPLHLVGPWPDTLERWYREGLPRGTDVHADFDVHPLKLSNISANMSLDPLYASHVLEETETVRVFIDGYGRTVRDFKDHTTMPEWLDFAVKSPDDLRRAIDEHYQVADLDHRFPSDWEAKIRRAESEDTLLLVDGGCYYWTLRSLAGVEYASYLYFDAPELVHELYERYNLVVMESLRRAAAITRVDLIGFGEDIAYKNGPLISPAMFREFILPHYRKVMDYAHSLGIQFTWYDSDGDVRQFIPDYLAIGINNLAPCEVAAGMDPVELRRTFGRDLRMVGGIDKREIAAGPAAIDAELARLQPVIEEGGYIPAIDHSISADISLENYRYFLRKLLNML